MGDYGGSLRIILPQKDNGLVVDEERATQRFHYTFIFICVPPESSHLDTWSFLVSWLVDSIFLIDLNAMLNAQY